MSRNNRAPSRVVRNCDTLCDDLDPTISISAFRHSAFSEHEKDRAIVSTDIRSIVMSLERAIIGSANSGMNAFLDSS